MGFVIGFDPGVSGAVAAISAAGVRVRDMPILELQVGKRGRMRRVVHAGGLMVALVKISAELDEPLETAAVWLELNHPRPKEGVVSARSNGRSYGVLEGVCTPLCGAIHEVAPAVWKKEMGVRGAKDASVARASQLFPRLVGELVGPKGGLKDGRAEALLIAAYGWRMIYGEFPLVSDHPLD